GTSRQLLGPLGRARDTAVTVVAPGYALAFVRVHSRLLGPEPQRIPLETLHYALELTASQRYGRWFVDADARSAFERLAVGLQRLSPNAVAPPAVFVRQPGAAFDRVAPVRHPDGRPRVVARDTRSGHLVGWRGDGIAVGADEVATWAALSGWS